MVYFEAIQTVIDAVENLSFNPCSNGWCTSRRLSPCWLMFFFVVSILVLMDGVLRALMRIRARERLFSFNPCSNGWCTSSCSGNAAPLSRNGCFNPCSNGWCTSRMKKTPQRTLRGSFNPCSNGWCTSRGSVRSELREPETFQSLF